jgi:hypothetical protein
LQFCVTPSLQSVREQTGRIVVDVVVVVAPAIVVVVVDVVVVVVVVVDVDEPGARHWQTRHNGPLL